MRRCHDEGIMLETETIQNREISLLRGMSYVFSILSYLQDEPLCKECEAFVAVLDSAREKFIDIEKAVNKNRDMPQGIRKLLTNIYVVLADLKIPDNPVSQKISGNCHLPSGMCLAESAMGFYEKLEESIYEKEASSGNGQ
jgi:hypothetical protein